MARTQTRFPITITSCSPPLLSPPIPPPLPLSLPLSSPCSGTSDASLGTMAIAVAVLLACTLFVMLTLVALSFYGASQVKFGWLERYEKLVVGVILCAVGILTHLFHHHDHPHGHHSHGHAGHAASVFAPGHTDIITAGTMLSHHH
ncbi:unnamed protein product [Closterium sp. Yama58-4]|nr:unnamed protein product [Closterium sp. Yama58-4]